MLEGRRNNAAPLVLSTPIAIWAYTSGIGFGSGPE
jgi:hypothetical protein